jgi:hypothetical protein
MSCKGIDFKNLKLKSHDVGALIDKSNYIDFENPGYKGDPIVHGGRFKKMPFGGK